MRQTAALLVLIVVLSGSAGAQESAPVSVFRSNVEAVQVAAVVTDRQGRHVSGLTSADFSLLEDGKRQKLASVEEVHSSGKTAKRDEKGGLYSNQIGGNDERPRVTLIVLDLVNTNFARQAYGRDRLARFLSNWQPAEPVALLTLSCRGLQVIHDFTADPKLLIASLHVVHASSAYNAADDWPQMPDWIQSLPSEYVKEGALAFQREMENPISGCATPSMVVYDALQQIARSVDGVPGRKSLLWLSAGLVLLPNETTFGNVAQRAQRNEGEGLSAAMKMVRAYRALADANVSMYPIDVSGLVARAPHLDNPLHPEAGVDPFGSRDLFREHVEMKNAAYMTGGSAFYDNNDIGYGMAKAVDDSQDYYLLTYYRSNKEDRQPGWRKLKVDIGRQGIKVRTRAGFSVTGPLDAAKTRAQDFKEAAAAILDFTSLPVLAEVVPQNRGANREIDFRVHVPWSALQSDAADGHRVAVDWCVLVKTDKADRYEQTTGRTEVRLETQPISGDGPVYSGTIALPAAEKYLVRFIARDAVSSKVGTLTVPVDQRAPNRKTLPHP